MLQQTQVETVLPFYERFLSQFPTIEALARSTETEVLRLWSGLGYYSRARNLRAAAERIVASHSGRIPSSHQDLLELPGIGRYIAGAIMSIAFNREYPIVDGNVRRVLSRLNGWEQASDKAVWQAAEDVVRSGEPRIVNQAMMELGATLCRPKSPRCDECPWTTGCSAFQSGRQDEIPFARKRPSTVRVDLHAVIDGNSRGILMREVEGLWEFPSFPELPSGDFRPIGECRHSITHHRVHVQIYEGSVGRRAGYRRVRFAQLPVTSLTQKIYSIYRKKPHANTLI